jgi:hypothetical protein
MIDGKQITGGVAISGETIPVNCNKPVTVAVTSAIWTDISAGLIIGARYELVYVPDNPADEVYFYLRDDTAANLIIAVETYGRPARSGAPIPITPLTATPLAILRHPSTAFDGDVYLTRVDN